MLPKSIKIGSTVYKVKYFAPDDSRAADRTGECSKDFSVITICKDLPDDKLINTVLHESLHGIWHEMAMSDALASMRKEDPEEYVITALANGLVGLLKDNPKLTEWFVGKL